MKRPAATILVGSLLLLPLGGCGGFGNWDFDPTELIPGDFLSGKKKLDGERKPVFPEGVPGVARGVPSDLMKGNPAPPDVDLAQGLDDGRRDGADESRPKAQPKARPKVVAKPPATEQSRPTPVTVRRSDDPAAQAQQRQQQPAGAEWPDPPPLRGQQQPQQESPQQRQQQSQPGQVQWPEPPPVSAFPR